MGDMELTGCMYYLYKYKHFIYYFWVTSRSMNTENDIAKAVMQVLGQYQTRILQEFPEVIHSIAKTPFRVSDLDDITPKLLADWNKAELLLRKPKRNKMHRFSLGEFVWVRLIQKMRGYNVPIKRIKAFRDIMMETNEDEIRPAMSDEEKIAELVSFMGDGHSEQMKAFLSQPELVKKIIAALPANLMSMNQLDGLILFCLMVKEPLSFMLNDESEVFIYSPVFLRHTELDQTELVKMLAGSYVSISLTEVLAESLSMVNIETINGELRVITEGEARVLSALREDGITSVVVRFDGNHEMNLLEVTKEQKVVKEARLLELILKHGYQNIEVKTENGSVVRCENTRKVKLK